ncbi:hypothetical protein MPL1032_10277 [Mesorhizobium plurifarium]|uniref:Uncharacterized protein n=1 Tax=Mesorhizobium plurifarium TaxID=69974 RepID=A0A0K2VNI0_MESPL|nr:hypothetical protein MPL1032_10277 [Mesorhizobium plurifarium]
MINLQKFPSDWYWFVGADRSRYYSSRLAAFIDASDLPENAGVGPALDEDDLWNILRERFPAGLPVEKRPPPLVPKRVIVDRLQAAGLLEAAKVAIDAADLYTQERWNTRMDIFANDPTALALLASIGGDPDVIFAPYEPN